MFIATVTPVSVNVEFVCPARLLNVAPPSVLSCHCTVGAGVPLAAAVNVAFAPGQAV